MENAFLAGKLSQREEQEFLDLLAKIKGIFVDDISKFKDVRGHGITPEIFEAATRVERRFMGLSDRTVKILTVKVFGSHTKGTGSVDSDLDLYIQVDDPDKFAKSPRLMEIVESIKNDFETATGIKIDINIVGPEIGGQIRIDDNTKLRNIKDFNPR